MLDHTPLTCVSASTPPRARQASAPPTWRFAPPSTVSRDRRGCWCRARCLIRGTFGSRAPGNFAAIPWPVALGSAERDDMTAFVVSNRTWRQFGDWSRLKVAALLSHAFFKRYSWTLDFDRQVYWLHEAASEAR